MTSVHYNNDRTARETLIRGIIGYGDVLHRFFVDKGHPNGAEIHEISSTGIITVYNAITHKMVTKMVARAGQIRRYYNTEHLPIPAGLIETAIDHQRKGYNYI